MRWPKAYIQLDQLRTNYDRVQKRLNGKQIMAVLSECPELKNDLGDGVYADKSTTEIYSEREIIHTKRGERIYRMSFTYVG